MEGIKETKEAILALALLGKFVAVQLKDGLDATDLVALVSKLADPVFKEKVMAGVQGLDKVPAEIKDINMAEMLELAQVIPQLIDVLKA